MKCSLQLFALTLAMSAAVIWTACGAHAGWTKTSVPKKTLDQVTGIEGVTYEKKFVPGVDFLGAAFAAAGVLTGISFFFKNKPGPIT